MIKKIIKKFPGATWLNDFLLERKIMRNFLVCSSLEFEQVNFYKQFIKRNELVFDVGCNVGCRTKLFLNLGAKVVGFEPQENLCNHLEGHLKRNKRFTLERTALGSKVGVSKIKISDAHVLSSMSDRWIEATKKSGRFEQYNWNQSQEVPVTTLDEHIKKHGIPKFLKIDVEGYEFDVLQGLTCPLNFVSIEFTAEDIENTIKCLDYLTSLGKCSYRYALGESLSFSDCKWTDGNEFIVHLKKLCLNNPRYWGDVYVKMKSF